MLSLSETEHFVQRGVEEAGFGGGDASSKAEDDSSVAGVIVSILAEQLIRALGSGAACWVDDAICQRLGNRLVCLAISITSSSA